MASEKSTQYFSPATAGSESPGTASLKYVLVTPARNEAAFIELTIQSVVAQTLRPEKWVVVSDGSTDGTDEIVKKYTARHNWMELLRMPERKERHFGGKALAFNAGCAQIDGIDYAVIGNLDADITFEPDYFRFLLGRFAEDPRLGVAGTPFAEGSHQYDYRFTNIEHVSGACQLFRRECYKEIGGYQPIKSGGIDSIAVTTARMKGWRTRTFLEKHCVHHRKQGSAKRSVLAAAFALGRVDYTHGSDILWQLFRSVYQMGGSPFVLKGFLFMAGYLSAMLARSNRIVSPEMVKFIKSEQRRRLRDFAARTLAFRRTDLQE